MRVFTQALTRWNTIGKVAAVTQHQPYRFCQTAAESKEVDGAAKAEIYRFAELSALWTHSVVNSETAVKNLLDLIALPSSLNKLYLDFEGVNVGRSGSISLAQVLVPGSKDVFLLDFVMLPNIMEIRHNNTSLREIFEGNDYVKFIFDPRNDIDCLYHKHGQILPSNVICLQLCDIAYSRMQGHVRTHSNGLSKVLNTFAGPLQAEDVRRQLDAIKDIGKRLFSPEKGGSYAVFAERPLKQEIVDYCCADVAFFPLLEKTIYRTLNPQFKEWVVAKSRERVTTCLNPAFHGKGRHMCIAPL